MDIALMNVRITIQKNKTVVDAIGNHKSQWSDYYSCFATVSGEGGSEKAVAGLIVDDSDISFTVRYCRALSNVESIKYRISFNDAIYNIVSIDHKNFMKKSIKFKCEKVRK